METSLNVKSSVVTKEEVSVTRDGKLVDERSRETKENNSYSSTTSEIWEPIGLIQRGGSSKSFKPFDSSDESRPNSNASSDQGYTTGGGGGGHSRQGASNPGMCPYCGDGGQLPDCPQNCMARSFSGMGVRDEPQDECRGRIPRGVQCTTSGVS